MKAHYRTTSSNGLRLRKSPHDGETLKVLPSHTLLTGMGEETWVKVSTADGQIGYVLKDFLEPVSGPFASAQNEIVCYTAKHQAIESDSPILINRDFLQSVEKMEELAAAHSINLTVTSSFRNPKVQLRNTVVVPSNMSNHHVGHALDVNFLYKGKLYGCSSFTDRCGPPSEVCRFIREVKKTVPSIRWGGDFTVPDYIHFDDGLNVTNPQQFLTKLHKYWLD